MDGLRIGEVAKRAGVNLQTIHYYERRGLLPRPPRTSANYRAYPGQAVRRIRFIKRAQELGFTLREVEDLLSLQAGSRARCEDVRRRAEAKVQDIEQRMRALQAMREALTKLIGECKDGGPVSECPILEALDAEDAADASR